MVGNNSQQFEIEAVVRPCHQKSAATTQRTVVYGWTDTGNRERTIWRYLRNLCVVQNARRLVGYD